MELFFMKLSWFRKKRELKLRKAEGEETLISAKDDCFTTSMIEH